MNKIILLAGGLIIIYLLWERMKLRTHAQKLAKLAAGYANATNSSAVNYQAATGLREAIFNTPGITATDATGQIIFK